MIVINVVLIVQMSHRIQFVVVVVSLVCSRLSMDNQVERQPDSTEENDEPDPRVQVSRLVFL